MKRYVGIDLSSTTGFVILDNNGEVIVEQEIFFTHKKDPERMSHIINTIIEQLSLDTDIICVENFSYNSVGSSQDFQFGLGWSLRENLYTRGFKYYDVAPGGVKKFATGKGNAKKEVIMAPLYRRWGYVNPSDNINDAFILAKIAEYIDKGNDGLKEHEKQVLRVVKNGVLNQDKWEEQKPPPKVRRKMEALIKQIKEEND